MPIVQIELLQGRSREKKRALIREVSHTVAGVLEVPLDAVRVVLHEIDPEHWGIGGETAAAQGRGRPRETTVPTKSRSPPR